MLENNLKGLKSTRSKKAFYASPAGQIHLEKLREANSKEPTTTRGKRRRVMNAAGVPKEKRRDAGPSYPISVG